MWQIVPIRPLYESFIFPFICLHYPVWGQTVQWAPYIRPIYALWTKDVKANIQRFPQIQHWKVNRKCCFLISGAISCWKLRMGPFWPWWHCGPILFLLGGTFADISGLTARKLTRYSDSKGSAQFTFLLFCWQSTSYLASVRPWFFAEHKYFQ